MNKATIQDSTVLLQVGERASAEILKNGAHVTQWKNQDGKDQLYLSPKSAIGPGVSVRGGIPIVFPQFADQGKLPKHGFLRTSSAWEISDKGSDDSSAWVTFIHRDTEDTRKVWNHQFEFIYQVILFDNGNQLKCKVTIKNMNPIGGDGFSAQVCLHTYFSIDSISDVEIHGLDSTFFDDKVSKKNHEKEERATVTIGEEVDRIYKSVAGSVELVDRKRNQTLVVNKTNMQDIVLWNPWVEKSASMADLPDDGYLSFVCIETGQICNPLQINSQSQTSVEQILQAKL